MAQGRNDINSPSLELALAQVIDNDNPLADLYGKLTCEVIQVRSVK